MNTKIVGLVDFNYKKQFLKEKIFLGEVNILEHRVTKELIILKIVEHSDKKEF